jgi:hypothetical protein
VCSSDFPALREAGSLTSVAVPPVEVEAARELMRAHDACRRDLMLLRRRVYPESSTWTTPPTVACSPAGR